MDLKQRNINQEKSPELKIKSQKLGIIENVFLPGIKILILANIKRSLKKCTLVIISKFYFKTLKIKEISLKKGNKKISKYFLSLLFKKI